MNINRNLVQRTKERYPSGTRLELLSMNDPYAPIPSGTKGTVTAVDDLGSIHMLWDNGRTLGIVPGEDSFRVLPQPEPALAKFYMPLSIQAYSRNEWGDMDDYPTELDSGEATEYEDQILAALEGTRLPEEQERGLMHYYYDTGDGVDQKVRSAVMSVETVNGQLMGVAECRIAGELTPQVQSKFVDYWSGQMSDGAGESFEQHPITTPDGELYVSFWNSGHDWHIMTEQEALSEQTGGMQLEQNL